MPEPRIPEVSTETVQTACVAVNGRAVLIESRSDEARTDLTLRMIDRNAVLVADDCTICQRQDGALLARAPDASRGRIDVRGLGVVELSYAERVPVDLLVVILDSPPRFPEDQRKRRIAGIDVPVLALSALDPSAPIKVELAVGRFGR
jgi:serine kinase of HPr protein (carbohydrate metabolism regulator)